MAQHDYVIDNSTGANVRADINSVLQAIASNNSGSSAPSTTYAFQLFANTTTSKLQIRNAANSAFVDLIGLDGSIALPDGSVSSPSLAFSDDLNTGIFSSAADTFNVATGGVERMELGATTIFNESGADVDFRIEGDTEPNLFYVDAGNERIGIHTATPSDLVHILDNGADATIRLESTNSGGDARIKMIANSSGKSEIMLGDNDDSDTGLILYNHSDNNLSFNTAATERMRLDDTGQLLIGHSGSSKLAGILAQVNIESVNSGNLTVKRNSANEFDATLSLGKTRATSIGGATIVQENDRLGTIGFFGSDGNDTGSDAAKIRAECDGTPGVDDMPGRLLFMTTSDGANGSTERMRIDSSGRVLIGTTSGSDALVVDGGSDAGTITTNSTNSNGNVMTFQCSGTSKFFIGSAGSFITGHSGTTDQGIRAEGKLIFAAGGSTERMSINTTGRVFIAESSIADFDAFLTVNVGASTAAFASHSGTTANRHALACCNNNGHVGGITTSGSATSFNTSSDYRLKENATAISDGITRLKTLKPYRFNFKADASTTVDGFFAHEVTAVPEAISGEKDAVKEDGSIDPQGIDQSKLVPLLVAAVQELIGKVEALEAA